MTDNIKLNSTGWNVKSEERNRGKMKLALKLNKEEAEAFKSWRDAVKPEQIAEEVFLKTIFFKGIQFLNIELSELAQKELVKQQLEKQKAEALADPNQNPQQEQAVEELTPDGN